ncbi:unnamed protein product [Amoebophrya sp. A120]|nr:unnamed protein product [Amoebophrya sp. A120]|eukprot:GSA120T00008150001.1
MSDQSQRPAFDWGSVYLAKRARPVADHDIDHELASKMRKMDPNVATSTLVGGSSSSSSRNLSSAQPFGSAAASTGLAAAPGIASSSSSASASSSAYQQQPPMTPTFGTTSSHHLALHTGGLAGATGDQSHSHSSSSLLGQSLWSPRTLGGSTMSDHYRPGPYGVASSAQAVVPRPEQTDDLACSALSPVTDGDRELLANAIGGGGHMHGLLTENTLAASSSSSAMNHQGRSGRTTTAGTAGRQFLQSNRQTPSFDGTSMVGPPDSSATNMAIFPKHPLSTTSKTPHSSPNVSMVDSKMNYAERRSSRTANDLLQKTTSLSSDDADENEEKKERIPRPLEIAGVTNLSSAPTPPYHPYAIIPYQSPEEQIAQIQQRGQTGTSIPRSVQFEPSISHIHLQQNQFLGLPQVFAQQHQQAARSSLVGTNRHDNHSGTTAASASHQQQNTNSATLLRPNGAQNQGLAIMVYEEPTVYPTASSSSVTGIAGQMERDNSVESGFMEDRDSSGSMMDIG